MVPRANRGRDTVDSPSTANPLPDAPIGPGGGEVDGAAEDEARSELQLFALCPSPVDMTMLDSFRLIVSRFDQSERGREKNINKEEKQVR